MLERIEVTDWLAHKKDPSAHHKADYLSGAGAGEGEGVELDSMIIYKPAPIQAVIDTIPFFPVESDWAPNGITIRKFGIKTWTGNSTYTAVLEEWTSPTDASPSTVATASTSASTEAEDTSPADPDIAVGSILMIDLPTTVIDVLQVWCTYTVN